MHCTHLIFSLPGNFFEFLFFFSSWYFKIGIFKGGATVIGISAEKAAALFFFVVLHLFGYWAPLLLECGGEEREISTTSRKFRKVMSIASCV